MKYILSLLIACSFTITSFAQVGIGTVSPNSTLDVRGSFSAIYRSFTTATSLTANDHTVVFTGVSAATATLPDATTCVGRIYCIKNFSASPITPALTISTVSAQKIDGIASWILDEPNEVVIMSSDGANWELLSEGVPSAGSWNQGGNSVTGIKSLGTVSAFDLPIITNNTEKMRITSNGYVGIGSTAFSVNPEALLVYQNNATSFNVIAGKGNLNNYLQLNIQNLSGGTNASSDVVATADNGNEITNYVDMGINSSGNTSAVMGSPDDAYLYTAGNNFLMGTANAGKALVFLTGGTTQSTNERMRIDGTGNMGIGNSAPGYKLDVNGAIRTGNASATNGSLVFSNSTNANIVTLNTGVTSATYAITLPTAQGAANTILGNNGAGVLSWTTVAAAAGGWSILGNAGTNPASNFFGTTDAQAFIFKENNSQVARFENTSIALGSGATTANSPDCYALGTGANIGFNKLNSVAIGTDAAVSNDSAFAIGTNAATTGQNAFSIGSGSQSNSLNSFAIGRNAYVGFSTSDAVAIGTNATVSGANAISIGSNITAANKTNATAASSIAMGNAAVANSANGIAVGTGATTGFGLTNPVAIGDGAIVNGSNSVALGNGASIGFINNAAALGAGASVSSTGNNSTAVGYNSAATLANELILGDRSNSSLSVGIGTESFSGSNREKLLVDAGATSSVNAIVGRGTIDSYLQLNIQNQSAGVSSSSDVVATANNGNETSNYVDMGINGGNYTGGVMGAANDAYLYNLGQNFLIGTGAANKSLVFMTGGTSQASNERMRIDGSGNLGLGTIAPSQKLDVNGNLQLTGAFMPGNSAGTAGYFLTSLGAGVAPSWIDATPYLGSVAWIFGGNNVPSVQKLGTTSNFDLPVITNNVERMRITNGGNVAIDPPTGVATFNATNPEKLLVDAGTTSSVNTIVGKGNNSTYLQLNIQNLNNGGNASSDVVATADNGNEITNFVDLGMNSSGNTSGVMGGADDAYLYTTGNNFLIGTATAAKALVFMTGGTTQGTNERMRITGTGNVGISTITPNSTLQVGGSMALPWVTKTSNYTILATDYTVLCNNTSGAITINLPTASGIAGRVYVIKKISGAGNNVTVSGSGAETIDGSATNSITTQYNSIMIQSDGTNWYILSKN